MSDIPEDIMAAAWDALGSVRGDPVLCLARALRAERERCAQIADEHARVLRKNFDNSCARAVEACAAAIRNQPPDHSENSK